MSLFDPVDKDLYRLVKSHLIYKTQETLVNIL